MRVTAIYYRVEGGKEIESFRLPFSKKATARRWAQECKQSAVGSIRIEIRKGQQVKV